MAYSSKSSSFHKILLLVFGIAFGLVALAMVFQGAKTSSDIRSRAAQTNKIYKQWEFNGKTTEGWNAIFPYTASVKGGIFVLSAAKPNAMPMFQNTRVGVTLPQGLKSVSLSMAVGPVKLPSSVPPSPSKFGGLAETVQTVQEVSGVPVNSAFQRSIGKNGNCALDVRACSDGSMVGRSGNGCSFMPCPVPGAKKFTAYLIYKLANNDAFERPVQFSGVTDGSFKTYTINLPNVGNISIDSMLIVLASGVKNKGTVAVDWIRILGPIPPKPTPTPTPSACGTVYNLVYYNLSTTKCPVPSSSDAEFNCPDGFHYKIKLPSCTPDKSVVSYVTNYCAKNNHCLRPTPSYWPTPRPTPPPTCPPAVLTGISYGAPEGVCTNGYAITASYTCSDGYRGSLNSTACQVLSNFKTSAITMCSKRLACPTPTRPPPTCGPIACPAPPLGCYIIGGTQCSCGEMVCSPTVYPSTTSGPIPTYWPTPTPYYSTPTPTPTPMTPTVVPSP